MSKDPNFYYFLVAKIKKHHDAKEYQAFFHTLFDTQTELLEVRVQLGADGNLSIFSVTATSMINPTSMNTFNTWMFDADDVMFVETWTNSPDQKLIVEVGDGVTVQPGFVFAGYLRCKTSFFMDLLQTSKREIVCSQLEELLRNIEDEGIDGAIWYPNLKQKTFRFHIESKIPITEPYRERLMRVLNQEGIEDLTIFEN